ncbi:MAG: hypothetical protein VYD90_19210 [Pseudomonadota bacterium]|nr:hypothetical protein [Pseudomonadota bacterium]
METAAIIAGLGVAALLYFLWGKQGRVSGSTGTDPNDRIRVPNQLPDAVLRAATFAAVVKGAQALNAGDDPLKAAALFSDATMRWVGTAEAWDSLQAQAELPKLEACPGSDVHDVIVVYAGELKGTLPGNRLATRATLKEMAAAGRLVFAGVYDRPITLNPQTIGFSVN